MKDIIQLDSIGAYNKLYGLITLHPLTAVIDLTCATRTVNHVRMNYGIYALYLKNDSNCSLKYGRRNYDYQEGTIVSFAPGQVVDVDSEVDEVRPNVVGLLFHPDLIYGTSLAQKMHKYAFFGYEQNEALHLSAKERDIIVDTLHKIDYELNHPIDSHSRELLCVQVEMVLEYCLRFYDRQFYTRTKVNNDVLVKFEQLLNDYFTTNEPLRNGLPTVRYFAERICLSSGYFGDLVKKETGRTAKDYIQKKTIEISKQRLLGQGQNVSEVAYTLGFQHLQHFTRLFKREVGCTPTEYRKQAQQ